MSNCQDAVRTGIAGSLEMPAELERLTKDLQETKFVLLRTAFACGRLPELENHVNACVNR